MKILGMEVKLLRSKRKQSDYGQFTMEPVPRIWVNKNYPKTRQDRTIIHEYFHAMFAQTREPGERLTEESAAIMFEMGVADLWFNNRELLTNLSEEESRGQPKTRAVEIRQAHEDI